jgi:hypothetical protein
MPRLQQSRKQHRKYTSYHYRYSTHDADPGKKGVTQGDHHPRLFLSLCCIATRANAMVGHGVRLTQQVLDWCP